MPQQIQKAAQFYESGDSIKADAICREILQKDQNHATALHLRGVIAYQAKDYVAAVKLLGAANKQIKGNINIMFALAASYEYTQQHEAAIGLYREVCKLMPDNTSARQQLAGLLAKTQQTERALTEYLSIYQTNRHQPDVLLALSHLYITLDNNAESQRHADALRKIKPNNSDLWNNLGIVYKSLNDTDNAIKCFQEAFLLAENHTQSRLNIASMLQDIGRFEDAKKHYLHVINNSDTTSNALSRAHYNLALIYLGDGNYTQGWPHLALRPKVFSDLPTPAEIKGKRLIILGEEGLGDELAFLRFLPLLRSHQVSVDYVGNKKLLPVLKQIASITHLFDSIPDTTAYDFCISAMDLPLIFSVAQPANYPALTLTAEQNIKHPLIDDISSSKLKPTLGITWRAGINTDLPKDKPKDKPKDQQPEKYLDKSIPIEIMASALKNYVGTVVILQRNPRPEEIEYLTHQLSEKVIDASSLNNDLLLMLRALSDIDNYFGVSNTNMHLFAGLGKTADVIVPLPGEWRWLHEGNTSPWHPNFGILRQTTPGNWDDILDKLPAYLREPCGSPISPNSCSQPV